MKFGNIRSRDSEYMEMYRRFVIEEKKAMLALDRAQDVDDDLGDDDEKDNTPLKPGALRGHIKNPWSLLKKIKLTLPQLLALSDEKAVALVGSKTALQFFKEVYKKTHDEKPIDDGENEPDDDERRRIR
eukprot:CAMPEP_0185774964 /NCGR_PEP_ID=MMETSP1174-20130828/80594_1 /TAXON_ID=35687 /ORGANISM="Dictyocha speculum, Strain CCMP1381" /LENGTH=128 /DNA_ID=CAMNT_0028462383 /DNA_START=91 /DNA_END=477 /DNA_ORIENTATION=+